MPTITVYPNFTPRIIVVDAPDTSVTIQEFSNLVKDWEDEASNLSTPKLISTAGKEDLGGGVFVGLTATLLNAVVRFAARTIALDSGTCDTTELGGEFLNDSTALFISDGIVYTGCTIFNSSTGEMETVLAINSETQLRTFPLSGNGGLGWTNTNGYVIYPNVLCNITGGNIVAVDSSNNAIEPIFQAPNVQLVKTSSASATLQELSAIQYASYNGGVTINVSSSNSGTEYPVGTTEKPVNNLSDALLIAADKGFDHLFIFGDLTISSGVDVSGLHLVGAGATVNVAETTITMESGCINTNTKFEQARIEGVQGGESQYDHCVIGTITNTHCTFDDCLLIGPVEMVNSSWTAFHTTYYHGCHTTDEPYVIDYNASPIKQIHIDVAGHMKFINMSHPGAIVHITLQGGEVHLDSSCTAGNVAVHGIGHVVDDGGGVTIDKTNLAQPFKLGEIHSMATDLHDEAFGKWMLNATGTQLTLYKSDGITVLKQFTIGTTTSQLEAPISRTPV